MANPGDPREPESFLPLKPAVFHILLVLAASDSHGYGVIQAVREASERRIRLDTGSFYRHLRKLIADGLVEEATDRPSNDDPRRGAYYAATGLGRRVLAAERARLTRLLTTTDELDILGDRGAV